MKGQIGPYELVAELGSGGMGTVYVARRTYEVGVTRTVALKTLRQDLSSQKDLVEMFLDEARITARISHPYVCSVMDIGTHRDVPYVTMDYIVGEPLSRLGPLMADDRTEASLANIVRAIANLCEGLHAAHELRDERGEPMHVVHRDISPDNLFVLYDGSVRVADFGIALTAAHQKDGKPPELAGKSGYMSPEQLRGLSIDRRADVWSMGVVLWELLAGKRLFRPGSEVAATVAVLEGPIPPVSRFNNQVPKGLDAIVARALERDRDKRYPSARAMALDLEQLLSRCFGPVSAGQVSMWLDQQFPGCQDFRRTIVARAEELRAQVNEFEFDPNLGILISTRPPANDQINPQILENVRRLDSLASLDVQLHESMPNGSMPMHESLPMQVTTNTDLIELDGFAQPPVLPGKKIPSSMRNVAEREKFPEPPRTPKLASVPSPRRKLAFAAIMIAMLALGAGLVTTFAHEQPVQVAEPRPMPAPKPEAPLAAPEPAVVPAEVAAVVAPEVVAPTAVQAPPVATIEEVKAAPAPVEAKPVAAALVPPEAAPEKKHHHRSSLASEAPPQQMGEVYVFANSGGYEVLLDGRIVKAPANLKLPIGTETITVRKLDDRSIRQVRVSPQLGRQTMQRLD